MGYFGNKAASETTPKLKKCIEIKKFSRGTMAGKNDDYENMIADSIDKLNVDQDFSGTDIDKNQLKKQHKLLRLSHPLIFTVTFLAIASITANLYFSKQANIIEMQQEELTRELIAKLANEDKSTNLDSESVEAKRQEIVLLIERLNELAKIDAKGDALDLRANVLRDLRSHFRKLSLDEKILDNLEVIKE